MQEAGIRVLGYVDTDYGRDSMVSVESKVDLYKEWYGVDGIMFDEMNNKAGYEAYYAALGDYVHSEGMAVSMGNPGTRVPTTYIGTLDFLAVYEGSEYPNLSYTTYAGYSSSNFATIVYGVSLDRSFLASLMGVNSWVYVTDDDLPNPYNALPSYFASEVAALSLLDGGATTTSTSAVTVASSTSTVATTTAPSLGTSTTAMEPPTSTVSTTASETSSTFTSASSSTERSLTLGATETSSTSSTTDGPTPADPSDNSTRPASASARMTTSPTTGKSNSASSQITRTTTAPSALTIIVNPATTGGDPIDGKQAGASQGGAGSDSFGNVPVTVAIIFGILTMAGLVFLSLHQYRF